MSRARITRRCLEHQAHQINKALGRPVTAYASHATETGAIYTRTIGHLCIKDGPRGSGYNFTELPSNRDINRSGRLTAREMNAFLKGILWGVGQTQKQEKGD